MSEQVKIIECPRDAWQGLPKVIPAEVKAEYLRTLIAAGFRQIDAVSFVSEKAVPQMADSEAVLELTDPPEDVEIIGIVVNAKGAERAVKTGRVTTLGFPYSISPTFLERNQRQTPEDALDQLEQIGEIAYKSGLDVVAYLSMAFGNPYGDAWDIDEVVSAVDLLVDAGVAQVSLADTAGVASADLIRDVMRLVLDVHDGLEVGVHIHTRPDEAAAKVRAAFEAGCRRFDGAIAGLGGCPFAQDALVGNLATEMLLATLRDLNAELPELEPLEALITAELRKLGEVSRAGGAVMALVRVEDDGGVRTITLNRPEKRNALTPEMQDELIAALEGAEDAGARVVVIAGEGEAFCAGLDLACAAGDGRQSAARIQEEAARTAKMFRAVWECDVPTIAVVQGPAIAGGTGLATMCDFTLATPEARFGYTEVRIGFVPALVSAYLSVQVGAKVARELLLSARIFDAEEARRLGLVTELVPREALRARAAELAAELMRNSPEGMRATKRLCERSSASGWKARWSRRWRRTPRGGRRRTFARVWRRFWRSGSRCGGEGIGRETGSSRWTSVAGILDGMH